MTSIMVRLDGGLGNQLFQTAFAYELSHRGHRVSRRADDPVRGQYPVEGLLEHELPTRVTGELARRVERRLSRAGLSATGRRIVTETDLRYAAHWVDSPPARAELRGYWQCERYFPSDPDGLRESVLTWLGASVTPAGEALAEQARSTSSVSLHVRRGDYVADPTVAAVHGALPLDYYRAALERFADAEAVYVFSDDLDWAVHALSFDHRVVPVGADHATAAHGEMWLMSTCRAHVIANSSFSWWGAWLGGDDHAVVAPRRWFSSATLNADDIVPARWERL